MASSCNEDLSNSERTLVRQRSPGVKTSLFVKNFDNTLNENELC